MQQIKNIIKGPYEPQDNTVLWVDTGNPDAPVEKIFCNGQWTATSGSGTEPVESTANKVTEITAESTNVEYPSAKAVNDAIELAIAPDPAPYRDTPLTIYASESGTTNVYFCCEIQEYARTIKVSVNEGDLVEKTASPEGTLLAALHAGDLMTLYGDNDTYTSTYIDPEFPEETSLCSNRIIASQDYQAYGNVMSLVSSKNYPKLYSVKDYAFYALFRSGLRGQSTGSILYANGTYQDERYCLFLPATKLGKSCYNSMFYDNDKLIKGPELPATELANSCYASMFRGCTSLDVAPALPATVLADSCYKNMFYGCSSLGKAPELPAKKLVNGCYNAMFRNCSSLNEIKVAATENDYNTCTSKWVTGVAASGDFYRNSNYDWASGQNGIPSGWTAEDYAPAQKVEYMMMPVVDVTNITTGTVLSDEQVQLFKSTVFLKKDDAYYVLSGDKNIADFILSYRTDASACVNYVSQIEYANNDISSMYVLSLLWTQDGFILGETGF